MNRSFKRLVQAAKRFSIPRALKQHKYLSLTLEQDEKVRKALPPGLKESVDQNAAELEQRHGLHGVAKKKAVRATEGKDDAAERLDTWCSMVEALVLYLMSLGYDAEELNGSGKNRETFDGLWKDAQAKVWMLESDQIPEEGRAQASALAQTGRELLQEASEKGATGKHLREKLPEETDEIRQVKGRLYFGLKAIVKIGRKIHRNQRALARQYNLKILFPRDSKKTAPNAGESEVQTLAAPTSTAKHDEKPAPPQPEPVSVPVPNANGAATVPEVPSMATDNGHTAASAPAMMSLPAHTSNGTVPVGV